MEQAGNLGEGAPLLGWDDDSKKHEVFDLEGKKSKQLGPVATRIGNLVPVVVQLGSQLVLLQWVGRGLLGVV